MKVLNEIPEALKKRLDVVYKTSITPFFPICLIAKAYSLPYSILDIKFKMPPLVGIIENGSVNWVFPEDFEHISKKILKKLLSDEKYWNYIKENEKELSKNLLNLINHDVNALFEENRLNKKGKKLINELFKSYEMYGYYVDVTPFLVQAYYEKEILEEMEREVTKANLKKEDKEFLLMNLFSLDRLSNHELFLTKILEHMETGEPSLKNLEKRFYHIYHDYIGEILDSRKLKKIIEKEKKEKLKEEVNSFFKRINKIKELKRKLPAQLAKKWSLIQDMMFYYNERKKDVLNKVNIFIRKVFEKRFGNISINELRKIYQLSPDELVEILSGKQINVEEIEKVQKFRTYVLLNGEIFIYLGKELYRLAFPEEDVNELKGTPASKGKVIGEVQIVLNLSQIPKFKEGKILVAPFTNVNYLPIMKKSKAILTEVGGLTSHAAIVSRELKIPCIVGIKGLIKRLKDGDVVEVDATRGVVRIIKG